MLAMLEALADRYSDGHYTILRFTTNYQVFLDTADVTREYIENSNNVIGTGITMDLAILDLITKINRR